jgi:hypothetical protein
MRNHVFAICVVMLACRTAVAEDPAGPVTESVKPREIQLEDVITVLMDRPSSSDELAEFQRTGAPLPTRCAASVVNIRPNGNLEIESRSEILHNGEYWERSLTGVVTPKTLGADRTVHSNDIAQCRIKTFKKGAANQESNPLAAALARICPRPDAPYAPTPVGLVTSPNASKIAMLRQKQADIAQLQQEVDQLRGEAGAEQQITVRVQVMEVSLTKMEKMGVDVPDVSSGFANMTAANAKQLLRTLSESNLGKMVSEPTVVTLDGSPASLHVGGEVPYPARNGAKGEVELRPIGTQLDVLPQTLGDNRIHLDFRLRVSNIDSGQMVDINGSHVPVLNVEEVDTKIETVIGNSVVLSGMEETRVEAQKRSTGKTEEVQNRIGTIFVVTPEVSDRIGRVGALPTQPGPYTPK